jgi:hypothetical protein
LEIRILTLKYINNFVVTLYHGETKLIFINLEDFNG